MYLSFAAILFVAKGEQVIQWLDGGDIVVQENDIVFLPKDIYVVSDFVAQHDNFHAYIFFIDDFLIQRFLTAYSNKRYDQFSKNGIVKVSSEPNIRQYLQSLHTTCPVENRNTALTEIKVLELLAHLELEQKFAPLLSSIVATKKKRSIREFMEAHCMSNLKISDYASLTGRSVSTFNREFKKQFGTTPKKWLIAKKLKKAHELLNQSHLNVTQVSMEVGYDNVSHFIEAYKKAYGTTPKLTAVQNT